MISCIKRIYAELRAKTFSIYYPIRMPHISRLLNLQKGDAVLDIGCSYSANWTSMIMN